MVEFCPRCGSILVPVKKRRRIHLVCNRCGYSKMARAKSGYKVREKVPEDKKAKVLVYTASEERGKERIEEERELLQEYYEVFLETMEGSAGED